MLERDGYRIAAVPVDHRSPAFGYVLLRGRAARRVRPEAAAALGVTPGPEFGRVQRGETVEASRPSRCSVRARPGRKLVISGDTAPCEALRIAAHAADVLIHEATFAEEERERAAETGHSTAGQAAELAREADVRLLALTHFSTRYPSACSATRRARSSPRTVLPRDFDTIEIPFAERGEPELVRWEEAARPTADEARRRPATSTLR